MRLANATDEEVPSLMELQENLFGSIPWPH